MFSKRLILALATLAAACDSPRGPSAPPPRPVAAAAASTRRAPAPDFTLTDVDGKSWRLSSLRGKPVVLSFWFLG